VPDRVLVQRVGGHARILADPRGGDCSGAAWTRASNNRGRSRAARTANPAGPLWSSMYTRARGTRRTRKARRGSRFRLDSIQRVRRRRSRRRHGCGVLARPPSIR
jgi:hypothetical protein